MSIRYSIYDGPEGPLLLAVDDDDQLVRLHFAHRRDHVEEGWVRDDAALAAWFAQRVDRPEAARAVGAANGQNPIAIVVPCHRVIGADGSLTGFGGGLPWKRWLLAREQPQGSLLDA